MQSERNEALTQKRIESYQSLLALLQTWEAQPADVVIANRDYIKELRHRVRQEHNYLRARSDPSANV